MSKLEEFLAGERLDDVAIFVSDEHLDSSGQIASHGETVEKGVVLVVPGETGREAFASGTGKDAMEFAREAMEADGTITGKLDDGDCPASENAEPESEFGKQESSPNNLAHHRPEFVFSFAEAQNESVGGLYSEGDVIHAYAQCTCGQAYADKWVVSD